MPGRRINALRSGCFNVLELLCKRFPEVIPPVNYSEVCLLSVVLCEGRWIQMEEKGLIQCRNGRVRAAWGENIPSPWELKTTLWGKITICTPAPLGSLRCPSPSSPQGRWKTRRTQTQREESPCSSIFLLTQDLCGSLPCCQLSLLMLLFPPSYMMLLGSGE